MGCRKDRDAFKVSAGFHVMRAFAVGQPSGSGNKEGSEGQWLGNYIRTA